MLTGGASRNRIVPRQEMSVPALFSEMDMDDLKYETLYLFFPECDKKIRVDMWRRELGGRCVTLVLDEFLKDAGKEAGFLYLVFWGEECGDSYASLGTLEAMSSGVEYKGSFNCQDNDVIVLAVNPDKCKKEISVPDDYMLGFSWGHREGEPVNCKWQGISTRDFGGRFVLNFAVSGEFNMSILYAEAADTVPHTIFSKSFCCK